jgi:hypothetical protein
MFDKDMDYGWLKIGSWVVARWNILSDILEIRLFEPRGKVLMFGERTLLWVYGCSIEISC